MKERLAIPRNWQDFESLCHRLWQEIWNDPNAQKNGRLGQNQNGVDVFGKPLFTDFWSGVQCKDKDGRLGSILTSAELLDECGKASRFLPKLTEFTLATTAPRDSQLQEAARSLTTSKRFPFSVAVWSWDDIEAEVLYRPKVLELHSRDFARIIAASPGLVLGRTTPEGSLQAFFDRPKVQMCFHEQVLRNLQVLTQELTDNAYLHGRATRVTVSIDGRKLKFTDNGSPFNPLVELDEGRANVDSHIGSFVLAQFLRTYSDCVRARYQRIEGDNWDENVFELEFSKKIQEYATRDFLEVSIDWQMAGARHSGERMASTIPISHQLKQIIWSIDGHFSLSFIYGFISTLLGRLNCDQRLVLYIPRYAIEDDYQRFKDPRLTVIQR